VNQLFEKSIHGFVISILLYLLDHPSLDSACSSNTGITLYMNIFEIICFPTESGKYFFPVISLIKSAVHNPHVHKIEGFFRL
jgi:hypothetical protein